MSEVKRMEKRQVSREKDGAECPSFSPDPKPRLSDFGQSDEATRFYFKARLDEETWVSFGKFSGHAPHLLSARKLPFKSFYVLVDPENNLHGVTSLGCLTRRE
jgi:hypothetical protein